MSGVVIPPRDSGGRQVSRLAITEEGWSFLAHFIECQTSTLDGIFCEDKDGNEETQHYAKFYDSSNNELTTQMSITASCVKSVFTIIPNTDIEIVSGEVHHFTIPLTDVRLHSSIGVIAPDGTPIATKDFVRNLNLKYKGVNKSIITDGRAPKRLDQTLEGVPYDANQIQVVVYHDTGMQHDFMLELEYYRP